MKERQTIFNRVSKMLIGDTTPDYLKASPQSAASYNLTPNDEVLFSSTDEGERNAKFQEIKQSKYLAYQWVKAGADINQQNMATNYTSVQLMYRDADLMTSMPEIDAAIECVAEEACNLNSRGVMVNVYSKSERIKSILEDLLVNRLQIHTTLPMTCKGMLKYGNNFRLLNITKEDGVLGWKELPVYEIDRVENGTNGAYTIQTVDPNNLQTPTTSFVWRGKNESRPFPAFTIAHFRNLADSFFLPYGVSYLHKIRRAWRMLSMMEDAMLVYRLDKSVERRVFKIYVGGINSQDVKAYVQNIANNFKRTPIIDPMTGQVDLSKRFLDVSADYFIPVRSENAPNPIETLSAAQNPTAMDDINYMKDKILAGLRVPKSFLNFQEAQGKGQNLSLMDIRFCRVVNRVQQYLLLELNRICMLHLGLLGFDDELTNFSLSMNNPSAQIEALEMEDLSKRVQLASQALADPGTGIPLLSVHRVLKEIMKMSDSEIADMFNEIRLEKAMAAELEGTANIIKKTGVFDTVDRVYGDYEAMNAPAQAQGDDSGESAGPGGASGGPVGGMDFGDGSLVDGSLGGPGDSGAGMDMGEEASAPMSDAPDLDTGGPAGPPPEQGPMEAVKTRKPLLKEEGKQRNQVSYLKTYQKMINDKAIKENGALEEARRNAESNLIINDEITSTIREMEDQLKIQIIENIDRKN